MTFRRILGLTFSLIGVAGCSAPSPAPVGEVRATAHLGALAAEIAHADHARFEEADRDGDGRLSPAECPDYPMAAFASLDGDGDGGLTFEEAMSQTLPTDVRARFAGEAIAAIAGKLNDWPESPARVRGNPVVFVPGWLDNGFWYRFVRKRLAAIGREGHFVSLFPNLGDISLAAEVVRRRVAAVRAETGAAKVDVMAHSMGGLISRYYIKNLDGGAEVAHYLSMATPHHGTFMAYMHPPAPGVQQMRPGSEFLRALNADDETPGEVDYVSIRASWDQIVVPHSSPILEGADNYAVPFAEHNVVQFMDETWRIIGEEWDSGSSTRSR